MLSTGRVVRFDEARGYGFITPDGRGVQEDVFLHVRDFVEGRQTLAVGTRVAYEVMEGQRGLKAYSVRVLDGDEGDESRDQVPVVEATSPTYPDDESCDVLTYAEFMAEITEALLADVPSLTGQQIVDVRDCAITMATKHQWVLP